MNLDSFGTGWGDLDRWMHAVAATDSELGRLLQRAAEWQKQQGFFYTLHEICHQPVTWRATAALVCDSAGGIAEFLEGAGSLVLTGSGSSQYVGECLDPVLRSEMERTVETAGAGALILYGAAALPTPHPSVLVSFARSGDSPESAGVVDLFREQAPEVRHLIVTCNAEGRLAAYGAEPGVLAITLDDRTNDRSLVMTSSFTNMVLAGRALGMLGERQRYEAQVGVLASGAETMLSLHAGALATLGRQPFARVVYLADGCRFGAARESALKMLEMTDGRVMTMAETYLGLRHGPMCAIGDDTLVVCFLASDPVVRAYECDVIAELNRKNLGATKLIVGEDVPAGLATGPDVVLDVEGYLAAGDHSSAVLDVVAGQLLAFFRCREETLSPDAPSASGVISRVVGEFVIHSRAANGG